MMNRIDNIVRRHLMCPKCQSKNYVIIDNPFFNDIEKEFRCNTCGYKKELTFEELDNFLTEAKESLKSSSEMAKYAQEGYGSGCYTLANVYLENIGDSANELLK